jgi:hypothetical protein
MWHEQSRLDRDGSVTIRTENIEPGYENNFEKKTAGTARDLGRYDYLSIMHYGAYFFARKDSKGKYVGPTIVCKDASYQDRIGQRDGLSADDIAGMKAIYP